MIDNDDINVEISSITYKSKDIVDSLNEALDSARAQKIRADEWEKRHDEELADNVLFRMRLRYALTACFGIAAFFIVSIGFILTACE